MERTLEAVWAVTCRGKNDYHKKEHFFYYVGFDNEEDAEKHFKMMAEAHCKGAEVRRIGTDEIYEYQAVSFDKSRFVEMFKSEGFHREDGTVEVVHFCR